MGLVFEIGPEVLDPRPETELLVERVLADRPGAGEWSFADVGTGSGAIAVSLLAALPASRCVAVDVSPQALATARRNAHINDVADRLQAIESDYLSQIEYEFDFIVSNPPYIRSGDIDCLEREVREHDPRLALDGGKDGLDAYRAILHQAPSRLREGGRLYLEIGSDQANSCIGLAEETGWSIVSLDPDYAGLPRILVAKRPQERIG